MIPPISKVKLGILIVWPTFWTGFPIKMVVALILLAAGLHPWEGTGLGFLVLLSIPVDIWALGVCARTVFLERLKVDVPKGLGLSLWWKWALWSALYLPLLYVIVGAVASFGKSLASGVAHFIKDHVFNLPVAEQITLELVIWGTLATAVLIVLLIGWLYVLGALAQRQAKSGTPVSMPYPEIVRFWDQLRVPSDQPLVLTAMTGTGVVLTFLFWGLMPATTPHPHDEYEYTYVTKVEKPVKPLEVIKKAEKILTSAEMAVAALEKSKNQTKDEGAEKGISGNGQTKEPVNVTQKNPGK